MRSDRLFIPAVTSSDVLLENLIYSLDWCRKNTEDFVTNLTPEELDIELLPTMNTIGTLLSHIAAMECYYRGITGYGRNITITEALRWRGAFPGQMQDFKIRGNTLEYYLSALKVERKKTLKLLKTKNDNWLYAASKYKFNMPVNNYYCWFHYMGDEQQHLGQIRMIKGQLRRSLAGKL